MSKPPEFPSRTPPEIDAPFIIERNISRAFKAFYFRPKGKCPKRLESIVQHTVVQELKSIARVAVEARTQEGTQIEHLKEVLTWNSLGYLAEIFAVSASRSAFGEEFAVSLSSFREEFDRGISFRFRQRGKEGRKLLVDLYTGANPASLLGKMEREFGRRNRLVLPLCLNPDPELPESINKILKHYPGIEFERLKELMAEQVWQAALTGNFDPEAMPSEWGEAVRNRTLAGYLIKRESGERFEPVPYFEKMIR